MSRQVRNSSCVFLWQLFMIIASNSGVKKDLQSYANANRNFSFFFCRNRLENATTSGDKSKISLQIVFTKPNYLLEILLYIYTH